MERNSTEDQKLDKTNHHGLNLSHQIVSIPKKITSVFSNKLEQIYHLIRQIERISMAIFKESLFSSTIDSDYW